jgi:hypothetical protein
VVDAVAARIAGRHPGTDSAALSGLLQQAMHDPGSVDGATFAAAIPGATMITPGRLAGVPGQPTSPEDPVELLGKLAALHDQGVIDDAEFAAQKARLLGQH